MGKHDWIIGVAFSFASSVLSCLGLIFQKYAHNQNQALPDGQKFPVIAGIVCSPCWWASFIMMGLFPFPFDFFAYSFAAQSLVAPFAGLTLIMNQFFAPLILKEKLYMIDVIASVIVFIGTTMTTVTGNHDEESYELDDLLFSFKREGFIAGAVSLVGLQLLMFTSLTATDPLKHSKNDEMCDAKCFTDKKKEGGRELISPVENNGDDISSGNGNDNDSGNSSDNGNDNGDGIGNGNDNSNSNSNNNGNGNGNVNVNVNGNGNNNSNDNSNVSGNSSDYGSDSINSTDEIFKTSCDVYGEGTSMSFNITSGSGVTSVPPTRTDEVTLGMPLSGGNKKTTSFAAHCKETRGNHVEGASNDSDTESTIDKASEQTGCWYSVCMANFVARPFYYGFISGGFGALQNIFFKCTGVLMKTSVFDGGQSAWVTWYPYVFLIIVAVLAILQLSFLNKGMSRYDAVLVFPLYNASYIFLSVSMGALYFGEFENFSTTQAICFPTGVVITIFGIILFILKPRENKSEAGKGQKQFEDGVESELHDSTVVCATNSDCFVASTTVPNGPSTVILM